MTKHRTAQEPFSVTLHKWIKHGSDKSLAGLTDAFGEKSFAIIFLLLMALPALPLPTGGVTHVFEVIVALICLELIVGRRTVWLPKRWLKLNAAKMLKGKALSKLISVIEWFERWSRRRWSGLLAMRPVLSAIGVIVLIYTVAAFVAPPFSGLDTLPSLGVVVISLSLILEDALILITGIIIGAVGIGVEVAAGTALYSGLTNLF